MKNGQFNNSTPRTQTSAAVITYTT